MATALILRPVRLLTSNSELRAEGIANWSIPAHAGRLDDGRTYNTCPSAGVCQFACYAKQGTYRFPGVIARHRANLAYVLDEPDIWQVHMTREIQEHYAGRWVRIHDAGDFFAPWYLRAWLDIAADCPQTGFYCYTKEIRLFRELVEPAPPANFRWVYSYGGRQDALLSDDDPRADVFPDEAAIERAGWVSQDESDLLAVSGSSRVGIPANNLPAARKAAAGRTFAQWQREDDSARAAKLQRLAAPPVTT